MRCPKCASDKLSVIDSRADASAIRRRRECQVCSYRFTTFERIELVMPMVVKKDGRRESFVRPKLRKGLERAFEKRPVSAETIERVVDSVEHELAELAKKEIPTEEIGEIILDKLKDIDQIAYVRFASVYREFSDVKQFREMLSWLLETEVEGGD